MSIKNRYNWEDGPAIIEQHSIAKHDVLRAYLVEYFRTFAQIQRRDEIKLTIIDGFAGGGVYTHADTNHLIFGSPHICIEAAIEAEIEINANRTKKIRFDLENIFIEPEPKAYSSLRSSLKHSPHEKNLDKTIFTINAKFEDSLDYLIQRVLQRTPRVGRAIFILDQFGYSDVPIPTIQRIMSTLPGAEVILTFNVDSLINFASDSAVTQKLLKKIGLNPLWEGKTLEEIKASDKDWRYLIQSTLYKDIAEKCGARYFTPFFIRNNGGFGDYWLIHLSQHHKARDVMTEVHWQNQNHFIHYGGSGLNMFSMVGYDPKYDTKFTGQNMLGFEFDDIAKRSSIESLMSDLPKIIYAHDEGSSLSTIFSSTCNTTPSTFKLYKHAIKQLHAEKDVEIIDSDGKIKRSASNIKPDDIIRPPRQGRLI